jgi:hypothetical protein
MWTILSIIAVVSLVFFWRGPNAVWGMVTIGLIGGLVAATIYFFKGAGFHWLTVGKWIVVCALIGLVAELMGLLPGSENKKK